MAFGEFHPEPVFRLGLVDKQKVGAGNPFEIQNQIIESVRKLIPYLPNPVPGFFRAVGSYGIYKRSPSRRS